MPEITLVSPIKSITINVADVTSASLYKNHLENILNELSHNIQKNSAIAALLESPTFIQGIADYFDEITMYYIDKDFMKWKDENKGSGVSLTTDVYFQKRGSEPAKTSLFSNWNRSSILSFFTTAKQENTEKYIKHMLKNYPSFKNLLDKTATNFKRSFNTALNRIVNDNDDIRRVFFPNYQQGELRLSRIITTGSDLHKQGEQVLILEVSKGDEVIGKVVYKPSTVLIDMMLVGNTKALAERISVTDPLNEMGLSPGVSAAEILNGELNDEDALTTYVVYPREQQNSAESYGYIEYLSHEPFKSLDIKQVVYDEIKKGTKLQPSIIASKAERKARKEEREEVKENQLPSDYIADSNYEVLDYAKRTGRLAVLSLLFGASDRHVENFIVSQHKPYLIDLENSLLPETYIKELGFSDITSGSLMGDSCVAATVHYMDKVNGMTQLALNIEQRNRLYYKDDNDQLKSFDVRDFQDVFMEGFSEVLHKINEKTFENWLSNPLLRNMMVRVLPFETTHFRNNIRALINNDFSDECMISDVIMPVLTQTGVQKEYHFEEYPPIIYFDHTTRKELFAGNVPVFFMNVNDNKIYNAKGEPIKADDQFTLDILCKLQNEIEASGNVGATEEATKALSELSSSMINKYLNHYYLSSPLDNLKQHLANVIKMPSTYIRDMSEKIKDVREEERLAFQKLKI